MHHWQYTEIAPIAPALPAAGEGVAALFPLLLWIIALSLLVIWRHTVGALLEHLAHLLNRVSIPTGFGHVRPLGFVASGLQAADYAVQQALSVSANACERAAVYLFHKSLTTFQAVGRELYRLAEDTGRAMQHLIFTTIPHVIRGYVHRIEHRLAQVWHLVHVVEHTLVRPVIARVGRLEHTLAHDFGLARHGIDVLERETRTLARRAEREAARVTRLEKALGVAAFAAAVAVALERLGLRWLRCPSLSRIGRRIGCGGFSLLEDLLAASFSALALSDICTFSGALTRLAEWYQPLLMEVVDAEDALIGCHGATKPDPLGLPRLYLPPVPDPLPLG